MFGPDSGQVVGHELCDRGGVEVLHHAEPECEYGAVAWDLGDIEPSQEVTADRELRVEHEQVFHLCQIIASNTHRIAPQEAIPLADPAYGARLSRPQLVCPGGRIQMSRDGDILRQRLCDPVYSGLPSGTTVGVLGLTLAIDCKSAQGWTGACE